MSLFIEVPYFRSPDQIKGLHRTHLISRTLHAYTPAVYMQYTCITVHTWTCIYLSTLPPGQLVEVVWAVWAVSTVQQCHLSWRLWYVQCALYGCESVKVCFLKSHGASVPGLPRSAFSAHIFNCAGEKTLKMFFAHTQSMEKAWDWG